jgi:hypothetical protein
MLIEVRKVGGVRDSLARHVSKIVKARSLGRALLVALGMQAACSSVLRYSCSAVTNLAICPQLLNTVVAYAYSFS